MRKSLTVGILPETKNEWERRSPLIPADVAWLVERKIAVEVLTSRLRVFSDAEYRHAGARVVSSFRNASFFVGVKEPPVETLHAGSIYFVFSHTTKGQPENRPLLKCALKHKITLIDYEHIVDARHQRLVYFGRFAGICGMIDSLHYLGKRYQTAGIDTPLLRVRPALAYGTFKKAKRHLRLISREIRRKGFDSRLAPFVVGIMGHGNVSGGAQEVLDLLHPLEIHPRDMTTFIKHQRKQTKQVYEIVLHREEKLRSKKGKGFYFEEYLARPALFESNMDQYLPHMNLLINSSYWDKRYPRLVPERMICSLAGRAKRFRLTFIGDLTCDVGGTVEITKHATTPGSPVFVYNPKTHRILEGDDGTGIAVFAVDNLPCEFPKDSSGEFSGLIRDYVYQIAAHGAADVTNHAALPREVREAVVTQDGKLTKPFGYLRRYIISRK